LINCRYAIIIGCLLTAPAFADPIVATSVSVGNLSVLADPNGTPGDQQLQINNLTGPGNCYADYAACTNLDFTDWTLTVTFTSSYYNTGTNPSLPDPFVVTSATNGDITPSSLNNVFNFDLCGGINIGNNCTPATTITSVEFSGQISPGSFCLYDTTVSGCNTTNPDIFFANPNFDLVWNGSSPDTPYVDEDDNLYAASPDITVSGQLSAPEPASLWLITGLLPFAWFARSRLIRRN
jgi:hypothetical protein